MAREFETQVIRLVLAELGGTLIQSTPDWLNRPGKRECGSQWDFIAGLYLRLTGAQLPEAMPIRESRKLDALIRDRIGRVRILEVDEKQHFNVFRALTLDRYTANHPVAFNVADWLAHSRNKVKLEGGGFAKPKPHLFPGENGRHRQRAFRDALCDILPPLHGYEPTIRVAYFEASDWIFRDDAESRMSILLAEKLR